MSGGHFDYVQNRIGDIADEIESILENQGKAKDKKELYASLDYYRDYPEEKLYYTYPEKVQEKMREAIKSLKIAQIYAQRVDLMLSGDDSEETFLERLEEDLKELNK